MNAAIYVLSDKNSLLFPGIISTAGFNLTAVITFLGSWLTSAVNVCAREASDTCEIGGDSMYSACEESCA